MAAEAEAVLDGTDLLHLDVRSDNLCFVGSRAVLVDWNWACRGNGLVDLAGWVPSLHAEGGPLPESCLAGPAGAGGAAQRLLGEERRQAPRGAWCARERGAADAAALRAAVGGAVAGARAAGWSVLMSGRKRVGVALAAAVGASEGIRRSGWKAPLRLSAESYRATGGDRGTGARRGAGAGVRAGRAARDGLRAGWAVEAGGRPAEHRGRDRVARPRSRARADPTGRLGELRSGRGSLRGAVGGPFYKYWRGDTLF